MIRILQLLADNDRMSRWKEHLLGQHVRPTAAEMKLFEPPLVRLDIAHRLVTQWSTGMTLEGVLGMRVPDVDPSVADLESVLLPLPSGAHIWASTKAYVEAIKPSRADARQDV